MVRKRVFCVETGRGPKGSIFVCQTPKGDVVLRARKEAPYLYSVRSEVPWGTYKITLRARTRRELREKIEEWMSHLIEG